MTKAPNKKRWFKRQKKMDDETYKKALDAIDTLGKETLRRIAREEVLKPDVGA